MASHHWQRGESDHQHDSPICGDRECQQSEIPPPNGDPATATSGKTNGWPAAVAGRSSLTPSGRPPHESMGGRVPPTVAHVSSQVRPHKYSFLRWPYLLAFPSDWPLTMLAECASLQVASRLAHLLNQLTAHHPPMRAVVLAELQKFVLRPNVSESAQYVTIR